MSKLNNLRGGAKTGGAIFASNTDTVTTNIFARMRGEKRDNNPQTSNVRKKYRPSRWRVEKGDTKTLIILDEQFTFAMREHNLKNSNGFWTQERCIADFDSCPICNLPQNKPYDVTFLTVLDLTPWSKVDPKTGIEQTFEYTKRVIALKKNDFEKVSAIASTQPSLRGLMLDMTRGHGEKESACGVPAFVKRLEEDELIEAFGSPARTYPSGFVLPENNAIQVFDYNDIYPVPTRDELAAQYGIGPRPGSRQEAQAQNETPPWEEQEVETIDFDEYPDVD